jgi:hypothetical protein
MTTMQIKDNLRYVDERYSDRSWQMRNDHILELFGLPPNGPIPPDYNDERQIGNVKVYIVPRGAIRLKRRVVALCPQCNEIVCAGHLDQHLKVHRKEKLNGGSKI